MYDHSIVIDISYKRIALLNACHKQWNISQVCRQFGVSRGFYYRWKSRFSWTQKSLGNKKRWPRISPRRTCLDVEAAIVALRKKTNYWAPRLQRELELWWILVGKKAIANILKRNGLTKAYHARRYRSKSKHFAPYPGYEVQIDLVEIGSRKSNAWPRSEWRHYYQYTAIDTHTKLRFLAIYEEASLSYACKFLQEVIDFFPFKIERVTTDNAMIFTHVLNQGQLKGNKKEMRIHPFTKICLENNIEHRLIIPWAPRMNCFVERSHRTDRQEFYWMYPETPLSMMQVLVKKWQDIYNTLRPHSSLPEYQTPFQYFLSLQANKN